MVDANDRVVGIRLRREDGRKFAVTGGREGLFIPSDLPGGGQLFITEGPTDCAALLDLGFAALGRPSCTGGMRMAVDAVKRFRPHELVIVADGDEPGRRGASLLSRVLVPYCLSIKTIRPPDGIKDVRAWNQAGATAVDIRAAVRSRKLRLKATITERAVHNER